MELSLRRWKPGQLLLGWAAYWAGLVGVTLSPAIAATWRATHLAGWPRQRLRELRQREPQLYGHRGRREDLGRHDVA